MSRAKIYCVVNSDQVLSIIENNKICRYTHHEFETFHYLINF